MAISNLNLNAKTAKWNVFAEISKNHWKQSFSEKFLMSLEAKLEEVTEIKNVA